MTSIKIKPPQLYVDSLGLTRRLEARAYVDSASLYVYRSAEEPGRYSWSSSAPSVATVDDTGLVTSVGWGTATITATSEGVRGETRVVVRDAVRLAWSIPNMGEVRAGIAVGADGTIYVASRDRLYAISPQGEVRWTLATSGTIVTPAIDQDGTLYLGLLSGGATSPSVTGGLVAVRSDGSIKWKLSDVGSIGSSPTVGSDGTIYAASQDGHVYAVDPSGSIDWAYESAESFYLSSPAVGSDGTIYVGGNDAYLHAINADGSGRWTFEAGYLIRSSPAIGPDGTIYVGTLGDRLYAVNPDGTERWSLPLHVTRSPSIGLDGTIYVGGLGVSAIDPSGWVRWTYAPNGGPTTPVLGADGAVYVANTNGLAITALDAEGKLLWDYSTGSREGGSPAIGLDGTILATSVEGTLYALVENPSTNGGYASSPWPQEHGDRASTGRAGG